MGTPSRRQPNNKTNELSHQVVGSFNRSIWGAGSSSTSKWDEGLKSTGSTWTDPNYLEQPGGSLRRPNLGQLKLGANGNQSQHSILVEELL